MEKEDGEMKRISGRIQQLSLSLEKSKIMEYVNLMENPKRLLYLNFTAGLAKGFGIAIGFSLLGAITILILRRLLYLNLPLIGDYIAELIKLVNRNM